jgi:hypothetical protein
MKTKHSKKLDTAIYLKYTEIYLRFLRWYLKQKMELGIAKEKEEEIDKTIKELNDDFQIVENWYKGR